MPEPPRYDAAAEGMKPEWRAAFLDRKKRRRWYGRLPYWGLPVLFLAFHVGDSLSAFSEQGAAYAAGAVVVSFVVALVYLHRWLRRFPCPRCGRDFCSHDADLVLADRDDLACARCGLPNPLRRAAEDEE